jgi:hypothetical protein
MKTLFTTTATTRTRFLGMTKAEALKIQAEQVAHYSKYRSDLAEVVAAITTADQLEDGVYYPIQEINERIPRGADIEKLLNLK